MISPLLSIVVEWQPEFVSDARQDLDDAEQKRRVIVPYGQFLGTVGMNLCGPMRKRFPHLAPPGWPG